MKTARSKACDIPEKIKKDVFERDCGRCVNCGKTFTAKPNAHYISRAKGGLGIEENIVTLCIDCHYRYDNGTGAEHKLIGDNLKAYLKSNYPEWEEKNLIYHKYGGEKC